MATEVAIFPVLPGLKPEDDSSEAGQQKIALLKILSEQPGYQRSSYGRETENPDTLRLLVQWDSVEHHKTFTTSAAYGPLIDNAKMIFDMSKAQIFHTHLDPHPAVEHTAQPGSPVTEVITIYVPEDYSEEDKKTTEDGLRQLMDVLEKNSDKCKGGTGGWVLEKRSPPGSDAKATAFIGFIGWDSVEDHLAFRETQVFKDNIHLLRGIKDLKGVEVTHISFEEGPKK